MKRFAGTDKQPTMMAIPKVVGIAVVAIQPQIIAVMFNIENIEVTIRISYVENAILATAH